MDKKAIERLKKDLLKNKSHDIFKNVQALFDLAYTTNDMELNYTVRKICAEKAKKFKKDRPEHAEQYRQLYKKTLLYAAPVDFDSYCQYIEWNRAADKRFYLPRRKQLKVVVEALQDLADDKLDLLAISMPPGVGKALADDTPILTRNGWKNHGDLIVGDEVIGLNGEFKKVLYVHPKCQLDVLVEFSNGEKIQCHENHEWMLYDRATRNTRTEEIKYFETRRLAYGGEKGHRGHRYRYQLPHKGYVVGETKDLPLDPYTLGVWLGDGNSYNPTICNAKCDRAIIDRIVRNGNEIKWETVHKTTGIMYYGFGFRKALQTFDLCHSRRKRVKYIPQEYLTASVEQRLELLAGLLDTDGSLYGGTKYQFTTCDIPLRDSFMELISTFGWRTCVSKYNQDISSSGIKSNRPHYVVSFTPDTVIPCELERKRIKEPHKQRALALVDIKRVEPKQGNCITVEGDGMYLAGKTMLPTHNTTIAIFYLSWIGGRTPNSPSLGGSHSNSFLRGVYDELLRLMDKDGEYLWNDVFPNISICNTNAKDMRIDLDLPQRFETFEFSSIGSGNAGKVRAGTLLYCDDLVDGIETAMSKERLDKLWQQYTTDLRQRKIGNCKELHIATRWSVHDVIGRLEQQYVDSDRARFIVMSALDENEESNFNYGNNVGFTTQFYHEQREIMDDVSWRALYMNEPIEREGLLYAEDELRRYFELPDREPDAIIAVCDTKDRGTDYCAMPIAYQYGNDFYIEDFVCDNSNPEIVEARLVQKLLKHRVHLARFESNSAGGKIAEKVQKEVKEKGGITKITTKFSTANKETRIIVSSGYAKEHFLFKDTSSSDKEYKKAIQMLCSYTMAGKNKNDDIPDSMAMLVDFVDGFNRTKVTVFQRPF